MTSDHQINESVTCATLSMFEAGYTQNLKKSYFCSKQKFSFQLIVFPFYRKKFIPAEGRAVWGRGRGHPGALPARNEWAETETRVNQYL